MKTLTTVGLLIWLLASAAGAWDTRLNPDRYPSFGMEASTGKLPGILTSNTPGAPATDGGFVKGSVDFRLPLTDAITLNAFGSTTGVNNNLQFSSGNELGLGVRVYLHD